MVPHSEDVRRYLMQTQELFGEELYLNLQIQHPDSSGEFGADFNSFEQEICNCKNCPLSRSRTKFVFGVGDPNASLLLVGEAPGAEEDRLGEPFVGRAGKLLDKILTAIGRNRQKDVYICNVLKCRPPNNRDPLRAEVEECEPYLLHQIRLIKPKLIVALGRVAGQTLLNVDKSLKSLRNTFHDYHGTPLMVTYHPAALLRNQDLKRPTWEDFKTIKEFLEQSR
ncbi:MAG TPA: uracil-DNA glycosylase [Candidatus Marinimicrobia bacterium]|jgi:DNA polymerase|nr:uracil-DNA glycosylase [Candidatus Neomarinimicrobiota bacterium]MDP6276002.1 uracil-DNA glycosylase [Candidatus Neomarinimicrobiota bacterium]MDP7217525.1 uracil-DNA glycosylase [Candidatus Neomarinimicrobiota bacterium]MDP7436464.1 uracil-DNA glycosylase [Candidatus Neomarinimicrobiota bacterium]HBN45179.1 uracil-DNA glycosylase [Candidatus Neomarinimicrobiota bacterium]|tara:strand:+ start:707 stop:1378 length:672 start_codon:yes stop_codon:yes gene_type:complete